MKLVAALVVVAILAAWACRRRPVPDLEPGLHVAWDPRTVTLASGADWAYTERPD